MSIGHSPETLIQGILAGIILVGRLGVFRLWSRFLRLWTAVKTRRSGSEHHAWEKYEKADEGKSRHKTQDIEETTINVYIYIYIWHILWWPRLSWPRLEVVDWCLRHGREVKKHRRVLERHESVVSEHAPSISQRTRSLWVSRSRGAEVSEAGLYIIWKQSPVEMILWSFSELWNHYDDLLFQQYFVQQYSASLHM